MIKYKQIITFMIAFVTLFRIGTSICFASELQYTDNLIPTMTADTTQNGTVSASSYSGSCLPYKAFDGKAVYRSDGSNCVWATSETTGWLEYDFKEPQIIAKYTILLDTYNGDMMSCPKNWTFEAWDGSNWVVVDTQLNVTTWVNNVKKEFKFNNTNSYSKYRINITANNGANTALKLAIGELEMMAISSGSNTIPLDLKATASDAKVDLSWISIEAATNYNLKYGTVAGTYTKTITLKGNSATLGRETLTPGVTYHFAVSAIVSGKESQNSNEVTAILKVPDKKTKLVLELKEQKQLSVREDLIDNGNLAWSSSDTAVATVDSNGKVKALKPGNTVITCKNEDGSYTEKINVLIVNLDYQLAVDLAVGDKCRLTVDFLTDIDKVTWKANDSTIATITNKGKVTAVSEGLTYIVAIDNDGNEVGRIYIRVR